VQSAIPGQRKTFDRAHPVFSLAAVSDYDSDCRILDIEPGVPLEEIRQAYRDQTKVWHPDRFSNDIRLQKKAEEKLKQINLAYQRLCGGGPYEPPVLNRFTERPPPGWIAVFVNSCASSLQKGIVALRRALRKSVSAITKPFGFLMAKIVNVSNKVFQWCRRQRRSLGIATTAFVLGFALGVWLLPRDSEAWAKINNLPQKIIEKAVRMAQVAIGKPSPTASTVLPQSGPTASSETAVPALPRSLIDQLLREAIDLRHRGDTTTALVRLQEALKSDPNNPMVRDEITNTYGSMQPFDRWNEMRRKLLEIGPSAGAAYELTNQGLSVGVWVPPIADDVTTSSSAAIARPSGDVFSWKTNVVTTVFWVGEEQVAGKTSPQHQSVWDQDWLTNFGGVDNPEPAARHDYIPISFVPRQNPFYCALPYNDVEQGQFKPEAPIVIPWFKQVHAEPGQSVCKDRWVAIRKGDRVCYAQWEDCGPFRTDHFQYVFQDERPTPNASHGAGLSVSPAVRDHLGFAPTDVADWRFVEVSDVPPGPWRNYGENNHFVIARRQLEKGLAEQKGSVNSAGAKPAQGAPAPDESVNRPPAVKLEQSLAEQKGSANSAEIKPAQGVTPADDSVMSPSEAHLDKGLAKQKGSADAAEIKPLQGATPADESVVSPFVARPEKGFAKPKRSLIQPATQPVPAYRGPGESVTSASAAKAVTTYAPRPAYPQEARSHRIAGGGVCVVSVDHASGSVTNVSMAQSTGSPLLDKSVLSTVRTWKFKPGTVSKVSIPVEFTMTGNNR
jgi:TonB family protein